MMRETRLYESNFCLKINPYFAKLKMTSVMTKKKMMSMLMSMTLKYDIRLWLTYLVLMTFIEAVSEIAISKLRQTLLSALIVYNITMMTTIQVILIHSNISFLIGSNSSAGDAISIQWKTSVYILKPCREIGQSFENVYEEIRLLLELRILGINN